MNTTTPIYVCPTSKQNFVGGCPVKRCPANITDIRNEAHGCAYLVLGDKAIIDKYSLAYIFKKNLNDTEDGIEKGKSRIQKALFFVTLMTEARVREFTCSKCGVGRESHGDCLNRSKCDARIAFFNKTKKRFPFNLETVAITNSKFYAFGAGVCDRSLSNLKLVEQTSTPLHKMIGCKKETLKRLKNLAMVAG
jgi:hypothetical protein